MKLCSYRSSSISRRLLQLKRESSARRRDMPVKCLAYLWTLFAKGSNVLTRSPPSKLLPGADQESNVWLVSAVLLYTRVIFECLSKVYNMSQAQRSRRSLRTEGLRCRYFRDTWSKGSDFSEPQTVKYHHDSRDYSLVMRMMQATTVSITRGCIMSLPLPGQRFGVKVSKAQRRKGPTKNSILEIFLCEPFFVL